MRILFLGHRLPYAPSRGDRIRAYHLLRRLKEFASVGVLSLVRDDEEASHAGEMASLAVSLPGARRTLARLADLAEVSWTRWLQRVPEIINEAISDGHAPAP